MDDKTNLARRRDFPPWESSIEPAPGELRRVQAFVNTRDVENGTDELASAAALAAWLRRWGLLERGAALSEADRRLAVDLREGLRALLLANNGEELAASEPIAGLERVLERLPLRLHVDAAGFRLQAVTGGWTRAAAELLSIVAAAMGDGSWWRLKACARDDCRWAFYDGSKNRSGRWCSMAGCGNLMNARAYRLRRGMPVR